MIASFVATVVSAASVLVALAWRVFVFVVSALRLPLPHDKASPVPSVGSLSRAGKYFGDFLRESPPKLAALSRCLKCRKRRVFRINRDCR